MTRVAPQMLYAAGWGLAMLQSRVGFLLEGPGLPSSYAFGTACGRLIPACDALHVCG